MKSLKIRLAPYKDQIVRCAREAGRWAAHDLARELADARDYLSFVRWLKDATNDENIGLCPTKPLNLANNRWVIRTKLNQAFDYYVSNLETIAGLKVENEKLDREIRELAHRLIQLKGQTAIPPPGVQLALIEV